MALGATGVWEVRQAGHADNAGYFNPGGASPGTDFSQQDAAEVVIDGSTVSATVHTTTTQINIAGATVSSTWNRNGLRITGGTATAGIYEITAVDVGNNRITVDRSAGSSTQTVVGRMGGAVDHPSVIISPMLFTHAAWLKGSFSVGSALVFPSGAAAGSTNTNVQGYGTIRGDSGRATLTATSGSSYTIVDQANQGLCANNLIVDGGGLSGVNGIKHRSRGHIDNCIVRNCALGVDGLVNDTAVVSNTLIEDCGDGITAGIIVWCVIRDCTGAGVTGGQIVQQCRIVDNAGSGINMVANAPIHIVGNIIANNASSTGNAISSFFRRSGAVCRDNIIVGNGGYGISWQNNPGNDSRNVTGNFFYQNTSGNSDISMPQIAGNNTELTADPFVNAAAGNYSLNDDAGGGAVIRAVQRTVGA